MTPPDTTSESPSASHRPAQRDQGRRRSGYAMLALSGVLAFLWGYFVWLRATAPTLPEVDVTDVEPMVADAIRTARAQVAERLRDPLAWGELGLVLHAHGFYGRARECYAQAERFDPKTPIWPYLSGDCCTFEGDPKEGIDDFRRAADRSGVDRTMRLRLGEAILEQGRFEDAKVLFLEVARRDPDEPRAQLGLGRVAFAQGDAQASVAHLQKCLGKTGNIPRACTLLAQAYHVLGEQALAADALARASETKEPHTWPDPYLDQVVFRMTGLAGLGRRATALYRVGRGEEGQALLEELVRRYPESAKARGGLGRMYLLHGQPTAAEPHLREALRVDADLIEVRYHLATALMEQQKCVEAVAEFRQVVERQPDHGEAYFKLGQCLYTLNDKSAAAAALKDAVRYEPQNLKARKNLGALYFEMRRFSEAVTHLELAAALDPEDSQIQSLLARARGLAEKPGS